MSRISVLHNADHAGRSPAIGTENRGDVATSTAQLLVFIALTTSGTSLPRTLSTDSRTFLYACSTAIATDILACAFPKDDHTPFLFSPRMSYDTKISMENTNWSTPGVKVVSLSCRYNPAMPFRLRCATGFHNPFPPPAAVCFLPSSMSQYAPFGFSACLGTVKDEQEEELWAPFSSFPSLLLPPFGEETLAQHYPVTPTPLDGDSSMVAVVSPAVAIPSSVKPCARTGPAVESSRGVDGVAGASRSKYPRAVAMARAAAAAAAATPVPPAATARSLFGGTFPPPPSVEPPQAAEYQLKLQGTFPEVYHLSQRCPDGSLVTPHFLVEGLVTTMPVATRARAHRGAREAAHTIADDIAVFALRFDGEVLTRFSTDGLTTGMGIIPPISFRIPADSVRDTPEGLRFMVHIHTLELPLSSNHSGAPITIAVVAGGKTVVCTPPMEIRAKETPSKVFKPRPVWRDPRFLARDTAALAVASENVARTLGTRLPLAHVAPHAKVSASATNKRRR